ncbi:T9SS type A sorting domain-containing protein [Polaribacter porphyrae]|uniref:T9SS type A sorting domain-containing protein n=1 Tax=Polaribacter porphyrae TaxID=1137780 RepID=UPI000CF3DC95|nr:T9SS type A sorting domain-containing protein [Polaribacter porphyrae]
MKKNYLFTLLFTLCYTFTGLSQTTVFQESFETGNSGTASETCNDGFDFFTRAKNDGTELGSSYNVSGQDGDYIFAAMDTDGSPCSMKIQTLTFDDIDISTYTNLTFAILLAEDQPSDSNFDWDGNTNFFVEIDIDNSGNFTKILQVSGNATSGSNVSKPMIDSDFDGIGDGKALTENFTEFTASMNSGLLADVRIVFENFDAGDEDIAIDNIRIIDGFVAEPSLSIGGITANQVFNPSTTEVPVNFSLANFTLSKDNGSGMTDNSGDGYIKTTLEETGQATEVANFFTATPSPITVVAGRSYTATAELVDNSGASLNPKVESSVSFSVAVYNQVANLAALRAGTEGEYYDLGNEVILTYARSNRNQKYIQDATGGMLIDDTAGTITTTYTTYDGITGLKGRLGSFGGVLQLVPDVDTGAATSTGNAITPEVVTLANYVANYKDYESELIKIEDLSFDNNDVGQNFVSSTKYTLTSGNSTVIFRTSFSEADYIGTAIPSGTVDMTAFGAEFDGEVRILPINLAGLVLGVKNNTIEGFATYPNPVTNNTFTISSLSSDTKQVSIFNVLGKRVFSTNVSGTKSDVDVSEIASGLYILKVTEGTKTATSKLVIE